MAKRFNEENSLGDVLKQIIQANNLKSGIDKIHVKEAWSALMGPGVNSYTTEVLLKGNTLYVALSSAVLREELSYGKDKIIKLLNDELKTELIKELVFR